MPEFNPIRLHKESQGSAGPPERQGLPEEAFITHFQSRFQIRRTARFSLLELEGHRRDGGEKLVLMLPRDKEEVVSRLLQSGAASAERVGDDGEDAKE